MDNNTYIEFVSFVLTYINSR